ncbi:MAG: UbiD family decarboxylase [Phycisphaerales bacterium]|nr:UbiD family decarboxylase [Phycisphaerales bacterium]
MPFNDLPSFVAELEQRDQLRRVRVPVDPVLEITEIADRVMKSPAPEGAAGAPATDPIHGRQGGRALLFENVRGSTMPVLINAYGSYARMKLALGCDDLEELAGRIQQLIKPVMPASLLDKIKKVPDLMKLAGSGPKTVRTGPCQQVVHTDDADLCSLPVLQCWPCDGNLSSEPPAEPPAPTIAEAPGAEGRTGRYITLGGTLLRDLDSGQYNLGMYRVQLFGPKLAAVHWHVHHDGARIFRRYAERGQPMPLAIVLGGPPVLAYAATCPLPPPVSELLFAGFLNQGGIEMVPAKTLPLEVPANAEIIIEGFVDPREKFVEGPFGDHTGFYSLSSPYPVFRVSAITHRRDPIYPTTIVGKPPMEDYYLGKATERIFLPLLQMLVPDILDYHLPRFGAVHNCAFLKIRKEYPYQARKVMHAIWGAGQMMFSKFLVVLDENVNIHDEQEVLFHIGANVDPRRDTTIVDGPLDILDHAAPYEGVGSKMGIDATRKIPGEGPIRRWPMELSMSPENQEKVALRWAEFGLE